MKEETLINIHKTHKWPDMNIDYGVYPTVDNLSDGDRKELLETLELLAERLRKNQYPFRRSKPSLPAGW